MGKHENEKERLFETQLSWLSGHLAAYQGLLRWQVGLEMKEELCKARYGPNWHCIVGKGFATHATYEVGR